MTCYSTTLLPSYLPYRDFDDIVSALCDKCLKVQYNNTEPESIKEQHFELTMQILEFWSKELEDGGANE